MDSGSRVRQNLYMVVQEPVREFVVFSLLPMYSEFNSRAVTEHRTIQAHFRIGSYSGYESADSGYQIRDQAGDQMDLLSLQDRLLSEATLREPGLVSSGGASRTTQSESSS